MSSRISLVILFTALLSAGAGCTPSWSLPERTTAEERGVNAEAIQLSSGNHVVVRGTVLGFGGTLAEDVGSTTGRRDVTIESFTPGQSADLSWSVRVRRETPASADARAEYQATVSGISDGAPEPPVRTFEDVDVVGSLATTSLQDATALFLPAYWPEGDAGVVPNNGLLWISTDVYDALVDTRESTLSLGLFDDVLKPLQLADNVTNALSRLRGQAEETSRYKDIYKLEAQPEFGSTRVRVNGEPLVVRTIQASNWFGTYVILANRNNPLVLKVTLNPLSFGALSLLAPTHVLDAFLGYEIVDIQTGT